MGPLGASMEQDGETNCQKAGDSNEQHAKIVLVLVLDNQRDRGPRLDPVHARATNEKWPRTHNDLSRPCQ